MRKSDRRREALRLWKLKWGLLNYRIFISKDEKSKRVIFVHNDINTCNIWYVWYNSVETRNLHTILKRISIPGTYFQVYDSGRPIELGSLNEIKRHFLLQKLAKL